MIVVFPLFLPSLFNLLLQVGLKQSIVVTFLALLLVSFDFCGWLMSLDLVIDEQMVKLNFSS